MKYNEFVKSIESLGFYVEKDWNDPENKITEILSSKCVILVTISDNERFSYEINQHKFNELNESVQLNLFNIVSNYAKTPLDKRNDGTRYYVKLDSVYFREEDKYVNKYRESYYFSDNKISFESQHEFTQDEIDNFPMFIKRMITDGYLIKEQVKGEHNE